jgi:glyoxylase-like metal-dependent hydrolase (beta-lactamase superfamily II)
VLAALDPATELGPVTTEDGRQVVEFTIEDGDTLWIAVDPLTHLPYWVRWISPSATLGEVTNTTYFTGYLPYDDVWLPIGLKSAIDWRDTVTMMFQVDSYRVNVEDIPEFPAGGAGAGFGAGGGGPEVVVRDVADGIWDLRVGEDGSGGAVVEFDDHLVMFEAYGSEAAALARIDAANRLVPGKAVTAVIVSHHHFDHSGGLRAAVSRGLQVISHRGNRQIFEEMVSRPAPNFPDALARNPQRLDFVPVDEHLVLEDGTNRVDVYHVVGHAHMANGVFAYAPRQRVFMEGDFTTYNWDFHWWGGAYLDNVDRYELNPAVNVPVHGRVTSFEEAIAAIEEQVQRAGEFCASKVDAGVFLPGCPVQYSRD